MIVKVVIIILLMGLLTAPQFSIAASNPADSGSKPATSHTWMRKQTADDKYAAYSMDGVTSASKLAAYRSHTVAGEDERNFAIFTGVVSIAIVVFVAQIVLNKK